LASGSDRIGGMRVALPLQRLIESFEKLPGIGPKTAQRLSYYLLHLPQSQLDEFSHNIAVLKRETVMCSVCKNIGESDPCEICSDPSRDQSVILVVEQPLDVIAFEKVRRYNGVYHVLHGVINPLENIGPDEIFINELVQRVESGGIKEIIIATNPTMEGDATAMYLSKKLKTQNHPIRVTRLGMGIPTGADLEYADEQTLRQAIDGRREMDI